MHRAIGDDALITISFARTLAESGTWGAYPGVTSNTQTSPLNAWLLAAGIAAVGRPIVVVGVLLCLCLAVSGWLSAGIASRLGVHPAAAWLVVCLLGTSPVLASTVGLETHLGIAVLIGVAAAALRGHVVITGVLCGLAVLTRPDLAVPAGVLALLLVVRLGNADDRRRPLAYLGAVAVLAALVSLPWHFWSWFALGGFVPDTMWVRTGDRSGPTILPAVQSWIEWYPLAGTASVLVVVAGLVAAIMAARRIAMPWAKAVLLVVLAGWAHLLALAAIDAQGAAWYYGPCVACSVIAVAIIVATAGAAITRACAAGVVGLGALGVIATGGVTPWTWASLVANIGRTQQYAAIAGQLSQLTGGQPVLGPGEVGAFAFYSDVPVYDFLTDPGRTDEFMVGRAMQSRFKAAVMKWSASHRQPVPPIPVRWQLTFASSNPTPPGSVIRTWPIDSPIRGADSVILTRLD
jgi:hypothetical protein